MRSAQIHDELHPHIFFSTGPSQTPGNSPQPFHRTNWVMHSSASIMSKGKASGRIGQVKGVCYLVVQCPRSLQCGPTGLSLLEPNLEPFFLSFSFFLSFYFFLSFFLFLSFFISFFLSFFRSFFLFRSCSPLSFLLLLFLLFALQRRSQTRKQASKQASTSCSPLDLVCCWGGALRPPPTPPRHEICTSSPTPAPATKSIF